MSSPTPPEGATAQYEHPSVEELRAVFELWDVTRVVVFYRARDGIERHVEFEPEAVRGLMRQFNIDLREAVKPAAPSDDPSYRAFL